MKITNKTIGWLLVALFIIPCHYLVYYTWFVRAGVYDNGFDLIVVAAHLFSVLFWGVLTGALLDGDIRFAVTVPTPLADLRATWRAKEELNRAIRGKYIAMAKAEGEDFERLNAERVALERALDELED